MGHDLNVIEARVLGCLLEKERLTPENYPLSLHSLTAACNQTTSRDPVVSYDEKTVEGGVNGLREKKLATAIFGAGSRVQKYRHKLTDHYELDAGEITLLCILLLRGPQTPGELRARAERMRVFPGLEAVEQCLGELAKGDAPLVRLLPARPGQKEKRYAQLLSSELCPDETSQPAISPNVGDLALSKTDTMEKEIIALKLELQRLRDEFSAFRKQFE